jgi:hypothetical protein
MLGMLHGSACSCVRVAKNAQVVDMGRAGDGIRRDTGALGMRIAWPTGGLACGTVAVAWAVDVVRTRGEAPYSPIGTLYNQYCYIAACHRRGAVHLALRVKEFSYGFRPPTLDVSVLRAMNIAV